MLYRISPWLDISQNIMNACFSSDPNKYQLDLRTDIKLGCGQVINGGIKKNTLTTGFRFIQLFLTAYIESYSTIICNKNCNY